MSSFRLVPILAMMALCAPGIALAAYTEELFLCDIGLRNADPTNTQGVDWFSYRRGGMVNHLVGTTTTATAYTPQAGYDRWEATHELTDPMLNLGSEYYGASYYLEFCYKWDRVGAQDKTTYQVDVLVGPRQAIANTLVSWSTSCQALNNGGGIQSTSSTNQPMTSIILNNSRVSLRCAIRYTYTETNDGSRRPHDASVELEPNFSVQVSP